MPRFKKHISTEKKKEKKDDEEDDDDPGDEDDNGIIRKGEYSEDKTEISKQQLDRCARTQSLLKGQSCITLIIPLVCLMARIVHLDLLNA